MPAGSDPDADLAAYDADLDRLLTTCRAGHHLLDEPESRVVAAAFAQVDTPLEEWGSGADVTDFARLIDDTRWLLDAAGVDRDESDPRRFPDGATHALYALIAYFKRRVRADHEHELRRTYATEFSFLRECGLDPSIAWTGANNACSGLTAVLTDAYELYATNGDACLVDPMSEETPGPWSVGIYERAAGDVVTEGQDPCVAGGQDPCFATAFAAAVAAVITRLGTTAPPAALARIVATARLHASSGKAPSMRALTLPAHRRQRAGIASAFQRSTLESP